VFLALAQQGFLPRAILVRNRAYGTPHVAIAITTVVPIVVVIISGGNMVRLGEMYAFGLLGAFTLSSIGLDVIRWRLHRRGPTFYVGVVTSLMLLVAWTVNLFAKPLATLFGGVVAIVGMAIAIGMREGVLTEAFYRLGFVGRVARRLAAEAERESRGRTRRDRQPRPGDRAPSAVSESHAARRPRQGVVPRPRGLPAREGLRRASDLLRLRRGSARALLEQRSAEAEPRRRRGAASRVRGGTQARRRAGTDLDGLAQRGRGDRRAADVLEVDGVIVGVSRRNALYRLLRGQVVKGLARRLPKNCHLILCN